MSEKRSCVAVIVAFKWVGAAVVSRMVARRFFARDDTAERWVNRRRGVVPAGWSMATGCRLYVDPNTPDGDLVREVRRLFFRPDLSGLN